MHIKTKFYQQLCLIVLIMSCHACVNKEISQKPNILFILIDDLGYKDLSCYGSEFYETPHIDRLAREGATFTKAYAASAVCSPTRASILTGKYPVRLGITDWSGPEEWHPSGPLNTPDITEELPFDELTVAEALKNKGYLTCFLGKWHLGGPEYYPDHHGFDICMGATNAGAPPSYFYPYYRANWKGTGWPVQIEDLAKKGKNGEYLTDRLTNEAINFLDTIGKRPFFLYLSHYAVHAPFKAKPELVEKYRNKAMKMYPETIQTLIRERNNSYTRIIQSHAIYGAMIQSVDESVGRLMDKLEKSDLSKNTIIIFTSDNGGYTTSNFPLPGESVDDQRLPTAVLPFRAGKGWYYEGGIRIPTLIKWPAAIQQNTIIRAPVISMDFYPTILEMAGMDLNPDQHTDGTSLVQLLKGESKTVKRKALFWHYPHYHNSGQTPASIILKGDYKLIHEYENNNVLLYNIEKDVHEDKNLSDQLPEKRDSLILELMDWKVKVKAEIPNIRKNED